MKKKKKEKDTHTDEWSAQIITMWYQSFAYEKKKTIPIINQSIGLLDTFWSLMARDILASIQVNFFAINVTQFSRGVVAK